MRIVLAAVLLAAGLPCLAVDPPPKPARLGLCAACHGETGQAGAKGVPRLAGQDFDYLVEALRQYRDGERHAVPMRAVSGALSAADIADLARWYANQVPAP